MWGRDGGSAVSHVSSPWIRSSCSTVSLQSHGNMRETPIKTPNQFCSEAAEQNPQFSPEALRLVCNAIISSAIAAVQLSEHISKWIARRSALVHTGAPAVMRTQLLLGHTQNRAAGEQWHRIQRKFLTLSLSLSCGISLVLNLITEDFQVSKM